MLGKPKVVNKRGRSGGVRIGLTLLGYGRVLHGGARSRKESRRNHIQRERRGVKSQQKVTDGGKARTTHRVRREGLVAFRSRVYGMD